MYCRIDNKEEKSQELCNHVKSKLIFYTNVYKKTHNEKYAKMLKVITDKL